MRVCRYDDGTVVSMDTGPCEDVLSSGAYLVDDVTEAEGGITTVLADLDSSAWVVFGVIALVMFGGAFATRPRRKK